MTMIISPGCTSRTRLKPIGPNAQSSDAMHHSGPSGVRRVPSTSGRMPFGSRKAMSPTPFTRQMHENAPSRSCKRGRLLSALAHPQPPRLGQLEWMLPTRCRHSEVQRPKGAGCTGLEVHSRGVHPMASVHT